MPLPYGTSIYVPVVVNKNLIAASMSNFPYQIDLSALLAGNASFKAALNTSGNIAVYDPVNSTIRPRVCSLDLTNNKLFLSFDGPTSTSVNKTFYICAGKNISQADSSGAFSASGYTNRWGFNEFTVGASVVDSVSGNTGTVNSPATIGNVGKFGNCAADFGTTGNTSFGTISSLCGVNHFDIEILEYLNAGGSKRMFIYWYDATHRTVVYFSSNSLAVEISNGSSFTASFDFTPIMAQWAHIYITCDLTQSTDANRLKVFVNGINKTLSFTGTAPATTYNLASTTPYLGHTSNSFDGGKFCEFGISSTIHDINYATTRYNQFFSYNTMFTLSTPFGISNFTSLQKTTLSSKLTL